MFLGRMDDGHLNAVRDTSAPGQGTLLGPGGDGSGDGEPVWNRTNTEGVPLGLTRSYNACCSRNGSSAHPQPKPSSAELGVGCPAPAPSRPIGSDLKVSW